MQRQFSNNLRNKGLKEISVLGHTKFSISSLREGRITPVPKHFTEQDHFTKNMKFSMQEWCSLKYQTPDSNVIDKGERNGGCGILGMSIPFVLVNLLKLVYYRVPAHSEHNLFSFLFHLTFIKINIF